MTCKEKLIADHPDWPEEVIDHHINNEACPHDYGYLDNPEGGCDSMTCIECWDREIPENIDAPRLDPNEVTKLDELATKKENEEMNCKCELDAMVKQLQFDNDTLMKECDELKKKLDEKSRLVDIYGARLDTKDVMLKKLNETNEDLANNLAAERAKNMKLQDMVVLRDEEIDKLVKENDDLMNAMAEKNEEIMNLRAEKDAMAAGKAKALDNATRNYDNLLDKNRKLREAYADLERCNNTQAESIKDLLKSNDKMKDDIESRDTYIKYICDKNRWLNDQLDAKNKRIQELCARIDKMNAEEYVKFDIDLTKHVYERLLNELKNGVRPVHLIGVPKEDSIIRPIGVVAKDILDLAQAYDTLSGTPIRSLVGEALELTVKQYKKQFDIEEVEEDN